MTRPTFAHIDVQALRANAQWLKQHCQGSKLMCVVKADAYGHDIQLVAPSLADIADGFAVAHCVEAIELRTINPTSPILVLEGAFNPEEVDTAYQYGLTLALTNTQQIQDYLTRPSQLRPSVWLKIDTGMHRLGLSETQLDKFCGDNTLPSDTVLFTHFSDADTDPNKTAHQLARLVRLGTRYKLKMSAANSPACLYHPDAHLDWVRPGYALYGGSPMAHIEEHLRPVMKVHTRIHSIRSLGAGECVGYGSTWCAERTSTIATLPIGYADGYPRSIANGTKVWLHNQFAPVVGRVSMDLITVDVTDIPQAKAGDLVELWGDNMPLHTLANHNGLSGYEIMARIPKRLQRSSDWLL
jgi:alanine racemase